MNNQNANDLATSILSQMTAVKGPQKKFLLALFTTLMVFTGKANFRNLSRYSDLSEKTFSRWYKRDFCFLEFNRRIIEDEIGQWSVKIAAMDASFMAKAGKHTESLGKFWNGCRGKSEKGLEISAVVIVHLTTNTAYTLDVRLVMGGSEETKTDQYITQFLACLEAFARLRIAYLAVDGYYSKKKFLDAAQSSGVDLVGKLRRDASLHWPYEGEYSGKGRPKKYDGQVDVSENLDRWAYCGQREDGSYVHEAVLCSKTFNTKLKVVLLRKVKSNGKWTHVLLFSTDLNLEAMTLIDYYKARFQIEFVFRDGKQHIGLVDCQARSKKAINTHVNAALSTLNLIKIEDRRSKKTCRPTVFSAASWKRLKANENLMRRLFCKLEIDENHEKVQAIFKEFREYGVIAA
jgi:hypothetical protein